jgi:hypothetical protein
MMIEKPGKTIGFFIPIAAKNQRTRRELLDRLGKLVDDLVSRSGIDEDELVREISYSPSQN